MIQRSVLCLSLAALAATTASVAHSATIPPSIFIRYHFSLDEVLAQLTQAQGKPLDPATPAARWLDEMGWRRWVRDAAKTPFTLTPAMTTQLKAQDAFLKSSFSYREGDAVWVPAEQGERPYGFSEAEVNPRGKITQILKGQTETYFVVEVGVDNGAKGGIRTINGKYYDGSPGPVLDYSPTFSIEKKTYIYSLAEMEKYNGAFRSQSVGSDTGATVNYTKDTKWLAKLDSFKDKVIANHLEIDFTASAGEVYAKQRALLLEMFNHFKMNRTAPSGGPLLGDVASGGGVCFTQACVLSHGVHAVGEPYGVRAMNISGSTVNPVGGHGFTRLTLRGVDEAHVYDLVKDANGKTVFQGLEIKSDLLHFISDPGWADYGKTPDQFAAMPVETAINPIPIDANRAIHELIQGKSFEEVVLKYGGKGAMLGNLTELNGQLFSGSKSVEFLTPRGQIAQAAEIEKSLSRELPELLDKAKIARTAALASTGASARAVKSKIFTDVVMTEAPRLTVNGLNQEGLKILLTEYLFRAVK